MPKTSEYAIFALCLIVVSCVPLSTAQGSPDVMQYPFKYDLRPIDSIVRPGQVTYEFTIWNNPNFPKDDARCKDEITIKLTTHGGLLNHGPSEWQIRPIDSYKVHIYIRITIPDADTTGFTLHGPCWISPGSRYFVTTGYFADPHTRVPIEVFSGDPRDPENVPYKQEWERIQNGWQPKERLGASVKFVDSTGREAEPMARTQPIDSDSGCQSYGKLEIFHHDEDSLRQARAAEEQRRREALEQAPLVGQQTEYISVGGQLLMREQGETKFYPAVPVKRLHELRGEDSLAMARAIDSVNRARANIRQDVRLDLRTPERLESARRIVDSLFPTDTAGIFRARVTRQMLQELWDAGIKVGSSGSSTKTKGRGPGDQSTVTEQQDSRLLSATDLLFHEGFESGFPNLNWDWVSDGFSGCDLDFWDEVSCKSFEGSYSAWCAGDGNRTDCQQYDCNMYAYMDSRPIDIRGRTNIWLQYDFWIDSESGYDSARVLYKYDNGAWHRLARWTGIFLWDEYVHDIPSSGDYVTFSWEFFSDSIISNYSGAYVDEISVMAD